MVISSAGKDVVLFFIEFRSFLDFIDLSTSPVTPYFFYIKPLQGAPIMRDTPNPYITKPELNKKY